MESVDCQNSDRDSFFQDPEAIAAQEWHSIPLGDSEGSEADLEENSQGFVYKKGDKAVNDAGPLLGHGDDGCVPVLQQVRAFTKSAKLSWIGFVSGDGNGNLSTGWSSLLQRSFSFNLSVSFSSEGESLCEKGSAIRRTTSATTPAMSVNTSSSTMLKTSALQARDLASRAEALPLAHYRPTDGALRKDGELAKIGLSTEVMSSIKSPVNSKKPPLPPRFSGRSASLDSAATAVQRATRKSRDRASLKRKSRGATYPAASIGQLTPLIALWLTIALGVLIVFQGVDFVQMNVSYGRNTDGDLVEIGNNARSSAAAEQAVLSHLLHPIDPQMQASSNVDTSNSGAFLGGAVEKSMVDLPWSRSSLISQMKSVSSLG